MTGKTALSRLFRHLAGRDRIDDIRDPVTGTYRITPPDMLDIGVESSKQAPWRARPGREPGQD